MSVSLKEVNDKISKAQVEQMHSYFSNLEDFKNGKLKALDYDVLELQGVADLETTNISLRHLQTYQFSLEQNLKFYIRVSAYKTSPENSKYPNREVFSIEVYNKDLLDEWMKCEGMVLMSRNNALEFGRIQKNLLTYKVLKLEETKKMQTQDSKSVLKELNEGIIAQKDVSNSAEAATSITVALTPMAAMQFNQQPPLNQLAGGAASAAAAAQDEAATAMFVRAKATG